MRMKNLLPEIFICDQYNIIENVKTSKNGITSSYNSMCFLSTYKGDVDTSPVISMVWNGFCGFVHPNLSFAIYFCSRHFGMREKARMRN